MGGRMGDRLLVVSGDGHVGARPETYRDYFDQEFREAVDELAAEDAEFARLTKHEDLRQDDHYVAWDFANRLRELDADGVAAEVLQPGSQGAVPPFFGGANRPASAALQWAGIRAYHRWLADGIAGSEGRLFGIAIAGPCRDLAATIRELEWCVEHGFVGLLVPHFTYDSELPPIYDRYFEPLWAACEDLGVGLSIHAGWGMQQGRIWEFIARFATHTVGQSAEAALSFLSDEAAAKVENAMAAADDSPFALDIGPRRALWQLMVSGVFDRHPSLLAVLTELRADWVPATIAALDARCHQVAPPMELLPSEYWVRNCFTTPSSIHESEVAMRQAIGVDRMMFGTDCPHTEGTYPHTRDWIRHTFRGVPERETRAILGDNAIRCYGLERARLEAIADRIGPRVDEVFAGGHVHGSLLDDFDRRAGLRRPAEAVDAGVVRDLLDEDLATIASA